MLALRDIKVGQRFGGLVIIKEEERRVCGKQKLRMFLCQCDYGREHVIQLSNLHDGSSCTCRRHTPTCAHGGLSRAIPWFIIDGLQAGIISVDQATKMSNIGYVETIDLKKMLKEPKKRRERGIKK